MKAFLIFSFSLFQVFAFSQKGIESDYLLKSNGDSVKCQVNQGSLKYPFETVEVLIKGNSQFEQFSADKISGFITGGQTYKSILSDINLVQLESDKSKWEIKKNVNLFAKLIVSGNIDLYESETSYGMPIYFASNSNKEVLQLIYHTYRKSTGELIANKIFLNQLTYLTKGKTLSLTGVSYDETSLTKLIDKFNNLTYTGSSKAVLGRYRVGLGATYFMPHIVAGTGSETEFGSTTSPTLSFEMLFPIGKSANFLNFGLNYNYYTAQKKSGIVYSKLTSFSSNNLFAFVGAKSYVLKSAKLKPIIVGGFGINRSFGGNVILENGEKELMKDGSLSSGDFLLRPHAVRWYLGFGLKFSDKIESELRFERIERYNAKSENGGKSSLNGFSLIVYYDIN